MTPKQQKESEKLQSSRWIHKGKIIKLREEVFECGGKTRSFDLIDHPGAVVIVPVDAEERILLIRQWRRAVDEIILELPAGTLEPGEDPLFCAQRELQEETGFKAAKLTALGSFYSAPGFCNEKLHLFIAEELLPSPLEADEDEGIDLAPVSLDNAVRLIEDTTLCDAKSIAGILRYRLWRKHGSMD